MLQYLFFSSVLYVGVDSAEGCGLTAPFPTPANLRDSIIPGKEKYYSATLLDSNSKHLTTGSHYENDLLPDQTHEATVPSEYSEVTDDILGKKSSPICLCLLLFIIAAFITYEVYEHYGNLYCRKLWEVISYKLIQPCLVLTHMQISKEILFPFRSWLCVEMHMIFYIKYLFSQLALQQWRPFQSAVNYRPCENKVSADNKITPILVKTKAVSVINHLNIKEVNKLNTSLSHNSVIFMQQCNALHFYEYSYASFNHIKSKTKRILANKTVYFLLYLCKSKAIIIHIVKFKLEKIILLLCKERIITNVIFEEKISAYSHQASELHTSVKLTIGQNLIQRSLEEDFYKDSDTLPEHFSSFHITCDCISVQPKLFPEYTDIIRGDHKNTKQEMDKNLHESNFNQGSSVLSSSCQHSIQSDFNKCLPPTLEPVTRLNPSLDTNPKSHAKQHFGGTVETTGYTTDKLPGAIASHDQHYETNFDETDAPPLSMEETRKSIKPAVKKNDNDSALQSYQLTHITPTAITNVLQPLVQDKTKPPAETVPSLSVNKSHRSLPRRACLVHLKEQYHLNHDLLSQPRATKYLVKVRTEISPGRYMAKLELHCSSNDDRLPNLDATQQHVNIKDKDQTTVPTKERKHFPSNINKIGYAIFSSNLDCFSGSIQYPLPNKKAVANRIGYGGNAIVFVVFHAGKEFAVKKTVYRSKEISVHSQLCHPNVINLEAVLIGEKHERHKDKHYVYCFMPKMDINFRNVLSTKEHGCLKHMKMQLVEKREQWELVLVNTKHVLRSVLKALDYMHSQGLVHRDIKASNILIKMTCQCSEVLYCNCQQGKFLVQIGDFDSSATVPGYQLQLEEHQMIRYASVLPLGTMGYRAPEVSMHFVLSGPYEILYTTSVDIWSFGCLLLTIFIGKSGPLKQRGASLLLSAQDYPYSQELYQNVIKIKEVQKYYANTPGVCDLVQKCLQVQPHCRPTAKELLQLDFFTS